MRRIRVDGTAGDALCVCRYALSDTLHRRSGGAISYKPTRYYVGTVVVVQQ